MINFFWESIKLGVPIWYLWLSGIVFIIGVIWFFISNNYPSLKIPRWIYKVGANLFIFSLILCVMIGTYKVYKETNDGSSVGFSTPDQLIGAHLEGLDIRIVDLARGSIIIKNRTLVYNEVLR